MRVGAIRPPQQVVRCEDAAAGWDTPGLLAVHSALGSKPGPASNLCRDLLAEQSCWDAPGHQKRNDRDGLRRHGVGDQGV